MIRRSPSVSLEIGHTSFEHDRPTSRPPGKLRTAMGKIGLFKTSSSDIPIHASTLPDRTSVAYSRDDLVRYLEQAYIDVTHRHSERTLMAVPIKMLPKLAIPEELTIIQVSPDNKSAADDFHTVATQNSLDPHHCPVPYTKDVDSTNRSYYVGYVTMPGLEPTPTTTLETLDIGGKGDLVRVDNVSTLEQFRGHNYAGVLISDALSDSQYAVAYLDSTPKAKGMYEHLGFVSVE
jgi:hypothetical protein